MSYIQTNKNQNWLLPMSINDMIPDDHICFLVEEFAESLGYSNFDIQYDGAGHPAYHPRIIMKIIIQGMLSRIRSSRKLAASCRENFIMMYQAEKTQPDFRTIARFRKDNQIFIKDAFKKTVEIASETNLIDLSFISIDGSKIKAYASKKRYLNKIALDKLDKAIDKMIKEDIGTDELEEELFGDKEEGLTGMDKKDIKQIVRDFNKSKNKSRIKENIRKAKKEIKDTAQKKISLTDSESRMMKTAKSYTEPSYNAQLSVSRNRIIISNDVCQDGHDAHQFIPQISNVKEDIKLNKNTKIGLDCEYSDGDNIKFAEDNKIDLYVPSRAQAQEFDGKEQSLNHDKYEYDEKKDEIIAEGHRYKRSGFYMRKDGKKIWTFYCKELKKKKDVPYFFKERLRMKSKMKKPESRKAYGLRKITVEPVIGNLKQNLGFREFLLRGLDNVKIEMNIACIAHNLQKIWRLRAAKGC